MKINSNNSTDTLINKQPTSLGARIGVGLIKVYRFTFSYFIGRSCRFQPTCSNYTETAIQRFGLWIGFWMGIARILRCHPFGSSGFDPVPDQLSEKISWYKFWKFGYWSGKHIDPATKLK